MSWVWAVCLDTVEVSPVRMCLASDLLSVCLVGTWMASVLGWVDSVRVP